jgi:hypothetical protein
MGEDSKLSHYFKNNHMKPIIVKIKWYDSFSCNVTWDSPYNVGGKYLVKTVGYLVKRTKKYIYIGTSIHGKPITDIHWNCIPVGCIKSLKKVK